MIQSIINVECTFCGKGIEKPDNSKSRHQKRHFCKREHFQEYTRQNNRKKCSYCGKNVSSTKKLPFCSRKHKKKYWKEYHRKYYHEKRKNKPQIYSLELSYNKKDLLDILNHHTNIKKDPCDCSCPLTTNSIDLIIQFVGAHNDLEEVLITKSCEINQKIREKTCIGGNRLVTAAAVVNYTDKKYNNDRIFLRDLSRMFYVSSVCILRKRKQINQILEEND